MNDCAFLMLMGGGKAPSLSALFTGGPPPNLAFARASVGAAFARGGALASYAINVPRFAYDMTSGAYQGLLVEGQRANGVRNSVASGAVAGTPGTMPTNWGKYVPSGLTFSVVGSGTEYGMPYVDIRYAGTPATTVAVTVTPESNNNIAGVQGEAFSASLYVRLVGGSLTNIGTVSVGINEFNASYAYAAGGFAALSSTLSAAIQRASYTRTLTNAATTWVQPLLRFDVTSGAAIDMTLRLYQPQIEKASAISSPIVTSGSAVTRAADVLSFTVPSGISTIRYTFDNDTTQDVAVSAGAYSVPTNLNRAAIKRIALL